MFCTVTVCMCVVYNMDPFSTGNSGYYYTNELRATNTTLFLPNMLSLRRFRNMLLPETQCNVGEGGHYNIKFGAGVLWSYNKFSKKCCKYIFFKRNVLNIFFISKEDPNRSVPPTVYTPKKDTNFKITKPEKNVQQILIIWSIYVKIWLKIKFDMKINKNFQFGANVHYTV